MDISPRPALAATSRRLPVAPLVAAYLRRGAVIWCGARATLAVTAFVTQGPAGARFTLDGPVSAPLCVMLAALLGVLDARRGGQRTLLANLGVSERTLAAIVALAAAAGEIVLRAASSAFGGA